MLYLHVQCLEKVPKQVSQMVVNDGDEFDRIPIHKKITQIEDGVGSLGAEMGKKIYQSHGLKLAG